MTHPNSRVQMTTAAAANAEMTCRLRHPLLPGGPSDSEHFFCCLCCDLSENKAPAAVHCPQCEDVVCEKCMPLYKDISFAMFLSYKNRYSMIKYQKNPIYATSHPLDHHASVVYDFHEEFNDTDKFRKTLGEKIQKEEKHVWDLRRKLAASEERTSTIKADLTCGLLHQLMPGGLKDIN